MDIYTVFTLGAITDKAYDKGSKAIDKVCEHQCPGLRIDICILFPWIKTCKSHAWITWDAFFIEDMGLSTGEAWKNKKDSALEERRKNSPWWFRSELLKKSGRGIRRGTKN